MTPPRSAPLHLAFVLLVLLGTHALVARAVPSDTGGMISSALAELPDGLGDDIWDLMDSMNMTEKDTHFSRLYAPEVSAATVNQSVVLVRFPTPENGFLFGFVALTHDLDPDDRHVVLVCGHTKPSLCEEAEKHLGAPSDHPCGPDDALDPMTGPFCEIVSLDHPSTEDGEFLLHGSLALDSVKRAYERDPDSYEVPTIHFEIVDVDAFVEAVDGDEEGKQKIRDAIASGDALEVEAALAPGAEEPEEPEEPPDGKSPKEESESNARKMVRLHRKLLRIGGGIRGVGMRSGIGGVGRFGSVGVGRGVRENAGRHGVVNLVLAPNFYGDRGGQRAYFNDPGIPGGR